MSELLLYDFLLLFSVPQCFLKQTASVFLHAEPWDLLKSVLSNLKIVPCHGVPGELCTLIKNGQQWKMENEMNQSTQSTEHLARLNENNRNNIKISVMHYYYDRCYFSLTVLINDFYDSYCRNLLVSCN